MRRPRPAPHYPRHALRRLTLALLCALVGVATLAPPPATAQERQVPASEAQIQLSFAPLVRAAAPAVVNIYAERRVAAARNPFMEDPVFRQFFGRMPDMPMRQRVERSLGSGVIVRADGIIVTNAHVIEGATDIRVVLNDRREFPAVMILSDPSTDLAVLRLQGATERLPVLTLGDSDAVQAGDLVLAIGNPFGVGQTVTSGIVSSAARTAVGITDVNFFIQTDAAINPGNSGGALLDMSGRVIGINSAIFSRTGGSLGIGFAVPANLVRTIVAAAEGGGRLVRPWLGVGGQPVTAEVARGLGLARPAGVLVNRIAPASPARGLREGDVIVSVNGQPVDDPDALTFRVATLSVGERITLGILREGQEEEIGFTAVAAPEVPPRDLRRLAGRHPFDGTIVANLSPAVAEELRLGGEETGVVVTEVQPGGAAARLGLAPGDVVLEVNGVAVARSADLATLVERPQRAWRVALRRGGQVLTLAVRG